MPHQHTSTRDNRTLAVGSNCCKSSRRRALSGHSSIHLFIYLLPAKVSIKELCAYLQMDWLLGRSASVGTCSLLTSRCKAFIGGRDTFCMYRRGGGALRVLQHIQDMPVCMWNKRTPTTRRNELVRFYAHVFAWTFCPSPPPDYFFPMSWNNET